MFASWSLYELFLYNVLVNRYLEIYFHSNPSLQLIFFRNSYLYQIRVKLFMLNVNHSLVIIFFFVTVHFL